MSNIISIILFSVFIILYIGLVIWSIKEKNTVGIIVFGLAAILFAFLIYRVIYEDKYGPYKELVTKYEMEHDGSKQKGNYKKNNLIFTHKVSDESFYDTYTIEDYNPCNLNLESYILDIFFDFKEGSVQRIFSYLKEQSEKKGYNARITIRNSHFEVVIEYLINAKGIEYDITESKEYRFEKYKEDDEEKTRKIYNSNYKEKYTTPELEIERITLDNKIEDFDRELIDLLFDRDISDFKMTNNYNMVSYTLR